MDRLRTLSSLIALAIPLLFLPGLTQAQTYLGDVCWEADSGGDDDGDENDIVKLAIQLLGEENITLNGFVIDTDSPEKPPQILFGSGTVFNGLAVLALTGTINDDEAAGSTSIAIQLALDTLAGPFTITGTVYDKQGEQFLSFSEEGTLTPTACP